MKNKKQIPYKTIVSLALLILLLVVIVPQLSGLKSSLNELKHADKLFIVLAAVTQFFNYVASTFVYKSLSKYKLLFGRTLLVEWAGGFTNRLLPAGLGALGLSALYLIKNKYSVAQASALVLFNNILGIVGNALLLVLLLVLNPIKIHIELSNKTLENMYYGLAAALILGVILSQIPVFKKKIKKVWREISQITSHYAKQPHRLVLALLASMWITLCHVGILYIVSRSVGASVSMSGAIVAMSGGNLVGAVTPTPGGLVGVEAGLTASLMAQGVNQSPALAIALLYRLFTYWLPIIPGFICFKVAQQKRFI